MAGVHAAESGQGFDHISWKREVSSSLVQSKNLTPVVGAFAKLRKATISFVMSVCPYGTNEPPLKGFSRNSTLNIIPQSVQKIQVSLTLILLMWRIR
jgi:hypothetical protein